MRNQQDRKISVQVFDRYTEPHLQGDKRESKRDQCYVLPQVTTSEFSYRDEIPTPISLRVKDLLESNIGGAVLFAETDGLEEAHDEVNRQQPDPVVKGGQNDFLLDETEEISTSDILDSRLWEVWVRRENEVSHSQSKLHPTLLSLTAEPSERSQRVKLWNPTRNAKVTKVLIWKSSVNKVLFRNGFIVWSQNNYIDTHLLDTWC